jgi:replicative DNA helicase
VTAPPQNLEAERGVLGAILLSERSLYTLVIEEGLRPEHFYREAHRRIYAAMLKLYSANEPIDPLTVADTLKRAGELDTVGGTAAIDELTVAVPLVGNARRYAGIVREHALRRQIMHLSQWAQQEALAGAQDPDDLVNDIGAKLLALRSSADRSSVRLLSDLEYEVAEQAAQLAGKPAEEAFIGLRSGLRDLDAVLNGLRPGRLYIIGGRPSAGKTALALEIAFHNAMLQGNGVFMASLEMQGAEVAERRLSNATSINLDKVSQPGRLNSADVERLTSHALREAAQSPPLWVSDQHTMTLLDLRAEALELQRRTKGAIKLLIVDYLQLLTPPPESGRDTRATIVGRFTRGLKQLSRELQVPVIALSQLSRESERRQDKRPTLSDLRESGDIEQDADVVVLVHREDYYDPEQRPGEVDLIVAKNRQGSRDLDVTASFQKGYQRFLDLSRRT